MSRLKITKFKSVFGNSERLIYYNDIDKFYIASDFTVFSAPLTFKDIYLKVLELEGFNGTGFEKYKGFALKEKDTSSIAKSININFNDIQTAKRTGLADVSGDLVLELFDTCNGLVSINKKFIDMVFEQLGKSQWFSGGEAAAPLYAKNDNGFTFLLLPVCFTKRENEYLTKPLVTLRRRKNDFEQSL